MIKERKMLLQYLLKEYKEQKRLIKQDSEWIIVATQGRRIMSICKNIIDKQLKIFRIHGLNFKVIPYKNGFGLVNKGNSITKTEYLVGRTFKKEFDRYWFDKEFDLINQLLTNLNYMYVSQDADIENNLYHNIETYIEYKSPWVSHINQITVTDKAMLRQKLKNVQGIITSDTLRLCKMIVNIFNKVMKEID